mmetsp:Transcript_66957/g.174224  ORF Transcript_66957/g.174224 Transcript_66957/m.174224 type:complete len:129 (-) Transcript_66957:118-504(-)
MPRAAGSASMKVMLSKAERSSLLDLGYSLEEANDMKLEVAATVLERRMRRPWGSAPMPREWRRGAAVPRSGGPLGGILVLVAAAALLAWLTGYLRPGPWEVEPVARALRGLGLEPRRPRGAGNRYGRL